MSATDRPFSFRSVFLPVFLPTLLFSIGEGAIIPMIPIAADSLGASLAIAGFIGGMIMIGEVIGDIPSGWVVNRVGERTAMVGASLVAVAGLVVCAAAPSPWLLTMGVFLVGLATAVFALARHAFMTTYVPLAYRARALSSLGGTFRAGMFLGPFIAAVLIHLTGAVQAVFWIHVACCLAAAAVLLLLPDPEKTFGRVASGVAPTADGKSYEQVGLFRTIWEHRGVLVRMGGSAGLVGAVRAARVIILPLWAVSIGVNDANTALIIGIAGAFDFALFYASGQVMDRFGRMWTAMPSMIGLGAGLLGLAFTHDSPNAVGWFIAIAMALGLANGIGSGILMTLGADLAPPENPAPFLGAFRFTGDSGSAAAPALIAVATALWSLPIATAATGVLGLIGAGTLARYIPRYVPGRR